MTQKEKIEFKKPKIIIGTRENKDCCALYVGRWNSITGYGITNEQSKAQRFKNVDDAKYFAKQSWNPLTVFHFYIQVYD